MTVYKPQNPSLLVTRKYIGPPSLDGHSGQDVGAIKVPGKPWNKHKAEQDIKDSWKSLKNKIKN